MKKVLILVIAAVSAIHAYAQNTESSVIIDSLTVKLEKLQHDYNYMSCDYELYKMKTDMDALYQNINIKSNEILIDVYNGRYNQALYNSFSDNYDSYIALYDALEKKLESVKNLIVVKIVTSGFSEAELNVIGTSLESFSANTAAIDSALKFYDVALQAYRDKR